MGNLLLLLYPWLFSIPLRCYLQQNIKVKILKYISSCHRSMGYENPVKKKISINQCQDSNFKAVAIA